MVEDKPERVIDRLFNHPWVAAERKKITDRIEEKYKKKKKEVKPDPELEKFKKWKSL